MTEHRIGQWPVKNPVAVVPSAPELPAPRREPDPLPPVDVCLTVTVDLTGRYADRQAVSAHFVEQTRRSQNCDTAVVTLGPEALDHGTGLGMEIAGAFYLSARRIEVHVPAGRWEGPFLHAEVARYVNLYRADHQRMQWQTAQASG